MVDLTIKKGQAATLTYQQLIDLNPCELRMQDVHEKIGDSQTWNGKRVTVRMALRAGVTMPDLLWVIHELDIKVDSDSNKELTRRIWMWAADCCAKQLPLIEKNDSRVLFRRVVKAMRFHARKQNNKSADRLMKYEDDVIEAYYSTGMGDPHKCAIQRFYYCVDYNLPTINFRNLGKWQEQRLAAWMGAKEPIPVPLPSYTITDLKKKLRARN